MDAHREPVAPAAESGIHSSAAAATRSPSALGRGMTIPGPTPASVRRGDMLYRTLGRTGELVSLIGLGGAHVGRIADERESLHLIQRAIDSGITFMDNSWDYSGGQSEIRMGKALRDGYRQQVFLMTKFDGRDKPTAARQIEESLRRLQTDHVDLLQFHEVIRLEDPDRFFAKEGALDALRQAQQAGKTRFVGFTGHKDPLVHLRMLDLATTHGFRFDTVQMPLNVMDAHFRSFTHQVLPVLVRDEIGVLGMKSMGDQVLLSSQVVTPIECLHYAMTLPTSVVITGIDNGQILDQALEAVRTFSPLSAQEINALLARTQNAALDGAYERFKTSSQFDSTAQHPEWMAETA